MASLAPTGSDKNRSRYIDGFPALAAFIASDRDGTSAIFKRFNRLAARNLLYLQCELAELQHKLDTFDYEDGNARETLQSLRNWEEYKAREAAQPERMDLLRKIRATMKEYRKYPTSHREVSNSPLTRMAL